MPLVLKVMWPMGEIRSLPVPQGLEGERVDVGLARLLGMSRSQAAQLVDDGRVAVNDVTVGKSHRLPPQGWLRVELPPVQPPPPPQPVEGLIVHHEDSDLVVIDKPAGVAAHASPGWHGPTVVGALAAMGIRLADAGPAERQGIVHRLDADTSGAMVVAKSTPAYSALKQAFKDRTVTRRYHSLVEGALTQPQGVIEAPIGRHPHHPYRMAVTSDGRPARTHYQVVEAYSQATLVELELETGRTHQIRVHLEAIGHPCVGDPLYNPNTHDELTRQWLHAVGLACHHPGSGQWVEFESSYPQDLDRVLQMVRSTPES